jgi:hypothetical protein
MLPKLLPLPSTKEDSLIVPSLVPGAPAPFHDPSGPRWSVFVSK